MYDVFVRTSSFIDLSMVSVLQVRGERDRWPAKWVVTSLMPVPSQKQTHRSKLMIPLY